MLRGAMMALCEDMLESARMVPHQIAQATKQGFLIVFDRVTGKPTARTRA